MEGKKLMLKYNEETGLWDEYKEPYGVVECQTKEDYEYVKKACEHYNKYGKWIRVWERLPEKSGRYLIYTTVYFTPDHADECDHYNAVEIAYFEKHTGAFYGENGLHAKAWTYLPEPPKESNREENNK